MATSPKGSDRRVQKTRQAIRQAFVEIVRKKGLMGATIQEVIERANISRGTFYAHYADKYELVSSIVHEEFQKTMNAALPADADWNKKTLHILVQTVLEYSKSIYQHHYRSREIAPFLEQAMQEELSNIILLILKSEKLETHSHLSIETIAQILSWTIFGAAMQWSQKGSTIPSDQTAQDVVDIIMGGVMQLLLQPSEKL